jgi:hypothetical protein
MINLSINPFSSTFKAVIAGRECLVGKTRRGYHVFYKGVQVYFLPTTALAWFKANVEVY